MLTLALLLAAVDGAAPAVAPPPQASAHVERLTAEAATSSGLSTFVGMVVGGLGVPVAVGLGATAAGVALPTDALLTAAAAGGATGAAIGGTLGALPTTEAVGVPLVALAGAGGALIGLVPAVIVAGPTLAPGAPVDDVANTIVSGSIAFAMIASSAAAAGVGALFAAEKPLGVER